MKSEFQEKAFGAISSVLPITALVLIVHAALVISTNGGMPEDVLIKFLFGAVLLVIGLTLVELGADMSLVPMGDHMGAYLTRTGRFLPLVICCFLIGALVTMAEPDLAVLVTQLPGVGNLKAISIIAAGIGVMLAFGAIRVIKRIPLPVMLALFYTVILVLSIFAPKDFFAFAFDSGGVATGPLVVPYILAIGLGLAASRGGKSGIQNSFGMVGLCTLGPIIAMLIFSMIGRYELSDVSESGLHAAEGVGPIGEFIHAVPHFLEEVAVALLPIIVFFLIFQFIFLRLNRRTLGRMGFGLLYTFIGHVLFLIGVNVGFLPAGAYLGAALVSLPGRLNLLLIPVGMLMGNLVVLAEPAVLLLNERVEEFTVGAVSRRAMRISLSIGVAVSVGVAMARVLFGLPLWWFLLAGYSISFALSIFVPRVFTAIAFDSGGVVSGAMTISFLLPFAKGACMALNDSIASVLTDAFGLVALVSITPVIAIQILGLHYSVKLHRAENAVLTGSSEIRVIEFNREEA